MAHQGGEAGATAATPAEVGLLHLGVNKEVRGGATVATLDEVGLLHVGVNKWRVG